MLAAEPQIACEGMLGNPAKNRTSMPASFQINSTGIDAEVMASQDVRKLQSDVILSSHLDQMQVRMSSPPPTGLS